MVKLVRALRWFNDKNNSEAILGGKQYAAHCINEYFNTIFSSILFIG